MADNQPGAQTLPGTPSDSGQQPPDVNRRLEQLDEWRQGIDGNIGGLQQQMQEIIQLVRNPQGQPASAPNNQPGQNPGFDFDAFPGSYREMLPVIEAVAQSRAEEMANTVRRDMAWNQFWQSNPDLATVPDLAIGAASRVDAWLAQGNRLPAGVNYWQVVRDEAKLQLSRIAQAGQSPPGNQPAASPSPTSSPSPAPPLPGMTPVSTPAPGGGAGEPSQPGQPGVIPVAEYDPTAAAREEYERRRKDLIERTLGAPASG